MSRGIRVRVPPPAAPLGPTKQPRTGGCTFAEDPGRAAPAARLIWRADLDPGTLTVAAAIAAGPGPDTIDPRRLRPWLVLVIDADGREHAVLSDGWRRIRIDVAEGSLDVDRPLILQYRLAGLATAERMLLPLRRLLGLCRTGRFAATLFPPDRRVARWVEALRVHDALQAGASQREIAAALFGDARVALEWRGASDSLRLRVQRLVRDARRMARGGFKSLLIRAHRGDEKIG